MTDELIDICNEQNNLLGIQKMKSEAHKKGLWHRAVHIWMYNSKGEILIQLRARKKELHPNLWDISAAGHVSAYEEPIISAVREIGEELGLQVKKENLEFFKIRKNKSRYKNLKNNEFHYIYFLKFEGNIQKLKFTDGEVQEIRFLPNKKLEQELKFNPEKYVPHGDYWFEVIQEVRKRI